MNSNMQALIVAMRGNKPDTKNHEKTPKVGNQKRMGYLNRDISKLKYELYEAKR